MTVRNRIEADGANLSAEVLKAGLERVSTGAREGMKDVGVK